MIQLLHITKQGRDMPCWAVQGWYLWLMLPFSKLESQEFPGQSRDFMPDRWLDSEGALIKEPRLFIPFSEGIRHCIGWRLAMDESKVCSSLLPRCPSACLLWLLVAASQGPHIVWRGCCGNAQGASSGALSMAQCPLQSPLDQMLSQQHQNCALHPLADGNTASAASQSHNLACSACAPKPTQHQALLQG